MSLGVSRLLASRRYPSSTAIAGSVVCIGVFATAAFFVRLDPMRMASGVYRTGLATVPADATVRYLRDGKTATISLIQEAGLVTIGTNGKPDASIQMGPGEATVDEVTMVLAAAVPLSMHRHPARVANIGFGSGLTTHTLLTSSLVKRLDSIEIEPRMVEAARQGFGPRISNVFADPRSHIFYEDAKTFFATTHEPYDLIVSEPSNPWVSGVATLFSNEFYGRITQYLAADGYFVQWLQIYETNIGIVASVMKALAPHFGAYALYNVDDSNILIVATRGTALPAPDNLLLQSAELRAELTRVGVQSVADLELREIGDNHTIGPVLRSIAVPANSDYYPFVDLNAPRLRYMRENAIELPALTVMPFPFLELLEHTAPRGPTAEPSKNSQLTRDHLVRRALEIRRAVASDSLDNLDPLSASFLWRIDMGGERCATKEGHDAWKAAVLNISDFTAAYLNATELAGIWAKATSSACYREVGGDLRKWADLLAAISRRDAPEIARLGTGLLADQTSNSDADLAYLTTVTAAAYVRMGAVAQAHELLQLQLRRIRHAGKFEFPIRELLALTEPTARQSLLPAKSP
jgi:spermidine synthase